MFLSAFFFSAMQIAIKKSSLSVPLMEQVFFRNIVSLIISFVIITKQKGSYVGTLKHQPLLFLRSSFGFAGLVAMFYASANANQGDVTTLTKLSPFLIALWAAIFLKEPIKSRWSPHWFWHLRVPLSLTPPDLTLVPLALCS